MGCKDGFLGVRLITGCGMVVGCSKGVVGDTGKLDFRAVGTLLGSV